MKCATNTLYDVLPQIGGKRLGGVHPRPDKRLKPLHFTVCRDPIDRAVSIWASTCLRDKDRYGAVQRIKDCGGKEESFEDFVRHCLNSDLSWTDNPWLFRNQTDWHRSTIIDKLVPMDNLKAGVEEIVGPLPELPVINESYPEKWEMTPTLERMLCKWAGPDLKLL